MNELPKWERGFRTSERIQEVVEQCPSGALTWSKSVNGEGANQK